MFSNFLYSRSGSAVFEITPTTLSAESDGTKLALGETQQLFKVQSLVIERSSTSGSLVVTHLTDSVQFRIRQHDDYLDVQLFGLDDSLVDMETRQGLMTQLSKFDATLLETQSIRQHKTSTLWINGKIFVV